MGRSLESYHSWPAEIEKLRAREVVKALNRLLEAARRRRLELDPACDAAEACRRESAAAAVALLAAVGVLAEEARS